MKQETERKMKEIKSKRLRLYLYIQGGGNL